MKHRFFGHGRDSPKWQFGEVKRMLRRLKACPLHTRAAVGAGVELANTDFMRRFGAIDAFRRSPAADQDRFWADLGELEMQLQSQGVGMAVGVGLYRIWLADMLAGRRLVAELLGEELTELSRHCCA